MSERNTTMYVCDVCGHETEDRILDRMHKVAPLVGLSLEPGMVFKEIEGLGYVVIDYDHKPIKSCFQDSVDVARLLKENATGNPRYKECWSDFLDYANATKMWPYILVHNRVNDLVYLTIGYCDGKLMFRQDPDSDYNSASLNLDIQMRLRELKTGEFQRVMDNLKKSGYAISRKGKFYIRRDILSSQKPVELKPGKLIPATLDDILKYAK